MLLFSCFSTLIYTPLVHFIVLYDQSICVHSMYRIDTMDLFMLRSQATGTNTHSHGVNDQAAKMSIRNKKWERQHRMLNSYLKKKQMKQKKELRAQMRWRKLKTLKKHCKYYFIGCAKQNTVIRNELWPVYG